MQPDLAAQTRLALRRLAKSVSVITLWWDDRRHAMAATAVEGLSLDPPSLLICVNRAASLAPPLDAGTDFCVNLLGRNHAALPRLCSSPNQGETRFSVGQWKEAADRVPILADAQARFICRNDKRLCYGTHLVVIGRIVQVSTAGTIAPLIFADGGYHELKHLDQS